MSFSGLGGNPYFSFGRRTFREQRLLAYIRRQHRRGRRLSEILDDPYVKRCGSAQLVWQTLRDTSLLALLDADCREAIQRESEAVASREA